MKKRADRIRLLVTVWFCGFAVAALAVDPTDPVRKTAEPAKDAPALETPIEREIGVEEAIHLANDAFDRLEAGYETDDLKAILDQANRYIELVETKDPANPWLTYLYARAYVHVGRRGEAVDLLRKFVETREGRNEWQAYRILGDLFVDEFPRLAKGTYDKASALNTGEPSVTEGLSRCALKFGNTEEAIRLARRAVAADGRQTLRYVSHLATVLKAASRWSEAREEAESALQLARRMMTDKPGSRAPLLVVDAQYKMLIEILQARVNEPGHDAVDDYSSLATYIRERGRITQMLVLHDVLRAIEAGVNRTEPDTPPALLEQYAIVLTEVGRTEHAIAVFEKLLEIDPNNTAAPEWLRRLRPEPAIPDTERINDDQ
ncbi:MAG: hypothetical protein WBE26_13175 [Phycisphaerae bacterium]